MELQISDLKYKESLYASIMHLSSHSVGSHHGIIAKHSLFVLKIPSVHVTVKVSQ